MCPGNHCGALSRGMLCTGMWTGRTFSPVCPPCPPFRLFPSRLSPAHHIMGTGEFHNKLTSPFQGRHSIPPFPGQQGILGDWWGLSAERHPLSSPLGQVWQQCPGSSVARGQAGTGQSCFMFLQFTFPTGFPRWFLCCGGPRIPQESRAKVCQAISRGVKSCPPSTAWLLPYFSIWSPGHLAQSPDACTAAKPGPPPTAPSL